MDKIHPEMLNALYCWAVLADMPFQCHVENTGTVHVEWQTGLMVPIFIKGDRRVGH